MQLGINNVVIMVMVTAILVFALISSAIRLKRFYNFQLCGILYVLGGFGVFLLGEVNIIHPALYTLYTAVAGILPFVVVHHSKRFSDWFESPVRKRK